MKTTHIRFTLNADDSFLESSKKSNFELISDALAEIADAEVEKISGILNKTFGFNAKHPKTPGSFIINADNSIMIYRATQDGAPCAMVTDHCAIKTLRILEKYGLKATQDEDNQQMIRVIL